MKKLNWYLIVILFLAAILRLYGLAEADVITDESINAIRSIGYIDFFASPYQTTPWEWFSDMPAWAKISFHDHPPLIFLISHLFFQIFGQNVFALRLPFVLFGLGSVFLLYLIGKKLFNEKVGLLASLLLAVSSYHVWISRIGLQESVVIFFCLLTFYFFLLFLDNDKHWYWGIFFGLAMLSKYTAIILLPIFIVYLLLFKRDYFLRKQFWLVLITSAVIFWPVLFYNFKLYQARGHFDFQLSHLLGQEVPEWQFLLGRIKAGGFFFRLKTLIPNLYQGMLLPIFSLFILSLGFAVFRIVKNAIKSSHSFFESQNKKLSLLVLTIFFCLVFFLLVGSTKRFISMVIPFSTLIVAWFFITYIWQKKKVHGYFLLVVLIFGEIFFTSNTLLAHYPTGEEGITYSYFKKESYSWGYHQLDQYLDKLLENKYPDITFTPDKQFLVDIKKEAINIAKSQGREPVSYLLIYDTNMHDLAALWLFHRRMIYQAWPIISTDVYLEQGIDFWVESGIKDFYFFKILDQEMLQLAPEERTGAAEELAVHLNDLDWEIIKRPDGRDVFEVYNFQ